MVKDILFVCTENSARSQMAEGFFNHHNKDPEYIWISAGTLPVKSIKPYAIRAMKEKGIDISSHAPKLLTFKMAEDAEKIITMGCIKGCPLTPKEKTEDWNLDDPAGKSIDEFRKIADKIEKKIIKLVALIQQDIKKRQA